MKRLRYSQIVGSEFYNIGLPEDAKDMVDVHFTAAAHHFHRMQEAEDYPPSFTFHRDRHRAHLKAMLAIVHDQGDFTDARDESLSGHEDRSAWCPSEAILPSFSMFNSMPPDACFPLGAEHGSDVYLPPKIFELSRRYC